MLQLPPPGQLRRLLSVLRSRATQLLFAAFVVGLVVALALAIADMANGEIVREGAGILVGAVLAFGGGVVTYRLGLEDQRRRTARALRTEIKIAAEGTKRARESLTRARALLQSGTRPFTITAPIQYPIFDALSRDLTLLHSRTLEAATRFYYAEKFWITAYQALASDAFDAIVGYPSTATSATASKIDRQLAYIAYLEAYYEDTWRVAAEEAYTNLADDGRVPHRRSQAIILRVIKLDDRRFPIHSGTPFEESI